MHRIEVTYRIVSPVILVTQTPDQNTVSTLDYFPGSAILGGFARLFANKQSISERLESDDRFRSWFLNEEFRFSDAHFLITHGDQTYPTLPAPLSLQKTKDKTVFYHPEMSEEEKKLNTKPIQQWVHIDEEKKHLLDSPKKKAVFHHQRSDYRMGHGEENSIFHYQALSEGQDFLGSIDGTEESLKAFADLMDGSGPLLLGRSKGSQYGRVSFHFGPIKTTPPLVDNIDDLKYERIDLRFISPVLLRNEHGWFAPDLSLLEKALGKGIKICKAYTRTRRIENFVNVWHMKRPSVIAMEKGSTFRIKTPFLGNEEWKEWLRRLQEGIGERRNEGFGQVDLLVGWDQSKMSGKDLLSQELRKPSSPLTEKGKQILRAIIEEQLKQRISSKAMNDSLISSDSIPSPHLLSRLMTMIEQAQTIDSLGKMVQKLQKKATNALAKCNVQGKSLLEIFQTPHLKNEDISIPRLPDLLKDYRELGRLEIEEKWQFLYIKELIRFLRIRKKQSIQGGD